MAGVLLGQQRQRKKLLCGDGVHLFSEASEMASIRGFLKRRKITPNPSGDRQVESGRGVLRNHASELLANAGDDWIAGC